MKLISVQFLITNSEIDRKKVFVVKMIKTGFLTLRSLIIYI
jgi:hypothetical protein